MRKVHQVMRAAFAAGKPAKRAAHQVTVSGERISYRLYSTDIVSYSPAAGWEISNGGWDTPTTRDALRAFGFNPAHAGRSPVKVDAPAWAKEGA